MLLQTNFCLPAQIKPELRFWIVKIKIRFRKRHGQHVFFFSPIKWVKPTDFIRNQNVQMLRSPKQLEFKAHAREYWHIYQY